jgi:hypothetical protein
VKLRVYAIKRCNQPQSNCIQLVVVDLDKSQHYPLNYVCVLPRYFRLLEKRTSQFARIFGSKSLCLAKKLLLEASQKEGDPAIKKVITKRIKDIDLKQECPKT